jgi:hypothetical protein
VKKLKILLSHEENYQIHLGVNKYVDSVTSEGKNSKIWNSPNVMAEVVILFALVHLVAMLQMTRVHNDGDSATNLATGRKRIGAIWAMSSCQQDIILKGLSTS